MAVVVRSSKGEGVTTKRGKFGFKAGAMWSRALGFRQRPKSYFVFLFSGEKLR